MLSCNVCNNAWLVKKPEDGKISPRAWHCPIKYCNDPQAKKYHEKENKMLEQMTKEAEEKDFEPF